MRQLTIGLSLLVLVMVTAVPVSAAAREGVPQRKAGGGTRWTTPRIKPAPSPQSRLAAMSFASRSNLPLSLKLKTIYAA